MATPKAKRQLCRGSWKGLVVSLSAPDRRGPETSEYAQSMKKTPESSAH